VTAAVTACTESKPLHANQYQNSHFDEWNHGFSFYASYEYPFALRSLFKLTSNRAQNLHNKASM
jgi:hypothetical protein